MYHRSRNFVVKTIHWCLIRTKIKLHKKVSTLDNTCTCVNFVGMCDKNKTRHKLNRRKFIQTKLSQSTVKVGEMEV